MKERGSTSAEASSLTLSRRDLFKLLGGGILILVHASRPAQAQSAGGVDAYLHIGGNGLVTIYTGKIEMGQGVITSLAQMAAEELDVALASVRMVMGDTALCPFDADGGTWGSLTTRNFGPPLRRAAAKARGILVLLASEQLGIARDQLFTRDGQVISRADETVRVSYASLVGDKTIERTISPVPSPKSFSQFTVSGQPTRRTDAVEKVTGQAKYAADIQLPGLLYARILRPPAHGATLRSADTSEAEKIAGVQIANTGGLLAVLHEKPDIADQALAQIKAVYDLPTTGQDHETIFQYLVGRATSSAAASQRGSVSSGELLAKAKVDHTYYTPYMAHAPIEPHAAVVSIENGKATVWASTQTPFTVRSEVASALGFSTANVRVITPFVGGGFGGKASNRQATEAARLAKAVGRPVCLAWTREEEFFYDTFQPLTVTRMRGGVDATGKISFWDSQIYMAGDRGAAMFYNLANYRIRHYNASHPFATGPWRAPGNNANTFTRESHMDALAAAAGRDPVEFRLAHLGSGRMRKVLEQAAASFGWQPAKPPSGRGFGLACGEDAGAYVVTIAQVEVDRRTGAIKVKRMLCAQDMGQVINPEGARMQMESGMMMGMGYSLAEELRFRQGQILDLNFNGYKIPRFSWMPRLETVLVENNGLTPQGGGEPPIITTGAALANAVFDAIGVRPTRLPMTPERVKDLLAQASPPLLLDRPQRAQQQIQLNWNGGPGIKLQKTDSLQNPVWVDVPETEGKSSVSLPAVEGNAFFRLSQTTPGGG